MPYKYPDLSDKAKEKVLQEYVENYLDYDWWDSTYEFYVEKLKELGITTTPDDIRFSGFYSQGDGASFTGTLDLRVFLEAHPYIRDGYPELYLFLIPYRGEPLASYSIYLNRFSHDYCHDKTIGLNWEVVDWGEDEDVEHLKNLMEGAEDDVLSQCRDYMQELYSDLEDEYDYLCPEESLLSTIEANDWTFTKEGELL